ncbi:hypothetical protein [Pseudomonas sp.]|uniref:hypothetical protein n=1 Tax=Pseudomonas sp. TaxID=306 RepID=UPI00290A4C3A|nr:hypothetical protein [Pseudomonas sp.]MDU4254434.1 hypothetical protein [Pseudomonas sp.]
MSNEPVDFSRLDEQFEALMKSRKAMNEESRSKNKRADGAVRDYAFRFLEEYAQWRYEHRGLAIVVGVVASGGVLLSCLVVAWLLAATSFGQAVGLDSARARATNAYYAAMWATKWATGAETEPVYPKRYSGAIEKIVNDMLVVVYYEEGKQYRRVVKPANVITTDNIKFKEWASQYHLKGISIEFYEPLGQVSGRDIWGAVMWYRQTPINVELVEQGVGYPEKNPPTVVVNKIFALYYWQLAVHGEQ